MNKEFEPETREMIETAVSELNGFYGAEFEEIGYTNEDLVEIESVTPSINFEGNYDITFELQVLAKEPDYVFVERGVDPYYEYLDETMHVNIGTIRTDSAEAIKADIAQYIANEFAHGDTANQMHFTIGDENREIIGLAEQVWDHLDNVRDFCAEQEAEAEMAKGEEL